MTRSLRESEMLPCAILCGGLATRLGSRTEKIPKSLMPINGEPFITHQLRLLRSKGIGRVVLCVGHLGEMIRDFVGSGERFGMQACYSFDGERLLGTGGAIRKALPFLGSAFFVLYGDSYLTCDYKKVAERFHTAGREALMTIYKNEGRFDASNVEAADGLIVSYDKRKRTARMEHIDYGLGVFGRAVFEEAPPEEVCDLAEIYQRLVNRGQLSAYEVGERFYEIGSEPGIQDLEQYLKEQAPARGLMYEGRPRL